MKRKILFLILILFQTASCVYSKVEQPKTKTVIVTGEAEIINRDTQSAKEKAKQSALRLAVEKTAGVYVASDTLVKNFELVEDNIYTKSSGFATIKKIINEQTTPENIYKITLEAEVSTKPLVNALKKLGLLKLWRIMVLIPQELQAETTLNKAFLEAGYKVVDQVQVEKIRNTVIAQKLLEGETSFAVELSRQFDADIILTGQALSEQTATSRGTSYGGVSVALYGCKTHLDLRAIKIDTGEIIAADETSATSVDATLTSACKKASTVAASKLSKFFVEEITKLPASLTSEIQLLVSGLYFSDVDDLEKTLKETNGVRRVTLLNYAGGVATYDIEYDGKIKDLAKVLETGEDFKKFNLLINTISKNRIETEVAEDKKPYDDEE